MLGTHTVQPTILRCAAYCGCTTRCALLENQLLQKTGYNHVIKIIKEQYENSDYDKDSNKFSKKELSKKYSRYEYDTFKCYKKYLKKNKQS